MFGRSRRPPENVVSVATETKPFARSQFYADAVLNVIPTVKTFHGTTRSRRPVSKPGNSNITLVLPGSEYRASNLDIGSCGAREIVTVCPHRMAKDDNVSQLTDTALWIVRTISATIGSAIWHFQPRAIDVRKKCSGASTPWTERPAAA